MSRIECERTEQALILLWGVYVDVARELATIKNPNTDPRHIEIIFRVMAGYRFDEIVPFVEGRWSGKGCV